MRKAGTILHISSLPSPYGIGTMGKEAYDFVDFLKASGLSFWQVLPLVPSGSGNSPYASYSMYAGNPDFIDLDRLRRQGLLTLEDIQAYSWGKNPARVDFQAVHQGRKALLEKAYQNSKNPLSAVDFDLLTQVEDETEKEEILEDAELLDGLKDLAALDGDENNGEKAAAEQAVYQPVVESVDYDREVARFRQQNQGWVEDYALYMALKERYQQKPWYEWDSEIANREPWAVERCREELREQMDFWVFVQYLFYSQWNALKLYANDNGVEMIQKDFGYGQAVKIQGENGWITVRRGGFNASSPDLMPSDVDQKAVYETNVPHYQSFVNSIRSRRDPSVPVEVGHSSCTVCTLGNIAYELNRPLSWNPIVQKFMNNDAEANSKLHYEYRKPYELE